MAQNMEEAQAELAFLKSIVTEEAPNARQFGVIYGTAGVLYAAQCLLSYLMLSGIVPESPPLWLIVGFLPTVIFLAIIARVTWRDRAQPFGHGTSRRAMNAAFAGGGIANIVISLVFGWIAHDRNDWGIWLIYPIVVCAFQGALWFSVAVVRRRRWMGATAAGWFLGALCLAPLIDRVDGYMLVLAAILFLCMALPGSIMARNARPGV